MPLIHQPAKQADTAMNGAKKFAPPSSRHNYHCLQRFDRCDQTPEKLLFAASINKGQYTAGAPIELGNGDWIGSGTVRNSLYLEPLRYISGVRQLFLTVEAQGVFEIRVMCAGPDCGCYTIASFHCDSRDSVERLSFPIGSITSFPKDSRIFWHVEAMGDNCQLLDVCFATTTPPKKPDLRMAVLLRTFGRSKDLKCVMETFWRQASNDILYQDLLDQLEFWILDTTPNPESYYRDQWLKHFNVRAYTGPNLGGGGNASVLIDIFRNSTKNAAQPVTELVILDDDLHISLESLFRYYHLCTHRLRECIVSLPVMEKSHPTRIWEDGAWWGRHHSTHPAIGTRRAIEPTLLKHGHHLDAPAEADIFCRLNICEYSTFIFLGISKRLLEKLGYPAAFFLRGDDIEYCLRANAAGTEVVTIPSLAAWHEPGHSYAQEYMAILHGIIINMTYSSNGAQDYAAFFYQRYLDHACIGDLLGLHLYCSVLRELNAHDSAVLTKAFDSHYKQVINAFSRAEWHKVPKHLQPAYEDKLRRRGRQVVPFLYSGVREHLPPDQPRPFVKCHPSDTYRELGLPTAREAATASKDYFAQLETFVEAFDTIAGRWKNRVKQTATKQFWDDVTKCHSHEIKRFLDHSRSPRKHTDKKHPHGTLSALLIARQDTPNKGFPRLTVHSSVHAAAQDQTKEIERVLTEHSRAIQHDVNEQLRLSREELTATMVRASLDSKEAQRTTTPLFALDGEAFVLEAYRIVLNRSPDQEGLRTYVAQLNRGVSKLRILQALAESLEATKQGSRLGGKSGSRYASAIGKLLSRIV
jgi:GT2 family glycosyltransferase